MLYCKVILFGGTFEPPHIGHLMLARVALEQSQADEVWFVPALSPPHKTDITLDYTVRTQMVKALLSGTPGLRVYGIEGEMPAPSFTVDTVQKCKELYPDIDFQFLIGADSLANLPSWHRADELTRSISFLVASRTGFPYEATLEKVRLQLPDIQSRLLEMPIIDLSSTWLRSRLQKRLPMCGLVPEKVLRVWNKHIGSTVEGQ